MRNDLTIEIEDNGVALVTLTRPEKHNAFDDHMIKTLTDSFVEVDQNSDIKVMVLAAQGKSFSAGGDIAWMKRMASFSYEENVADAQLLANMLKTLDQLSKPTIARVQGAAYGGGVGLACCCDVAVGVPETSMCLSEVKIGLAPATICPYVVAAIGQRASRRYALTAEVIDASTALQLGLLSAVVDFDQLDQEVERFCNAFLSNGSHGMGSAKKLIAEVAGQGLTDELIANTSHVIATLRESDDAQLRLANFINKRSTSKSAESKG